MSSIQRTGIVILVTVLVIFGIYRYGFHNGWSERDAEMQAEIAKKNEESRKIEHELNNQINQGANKLQEANNAITQKQSDLDRAIRAGRVRLPAPSCVQAAPSAPAPAGDRTESQTQPNRTADEPSDAERETLRLIAQIAADGDRAINQLNACIDAYNQVREQLNGQR